MSLTSTELARLGVLLDESLSLSLEERRAWLTTLAPGDEPLRKTLSDALLAEHPAPLAEGLLSRPPHIMAPGSAIEHHAGDRLGAYELLRPLGSGGMAEVWLARRVDGAFERQIALKIPRLGALPAQMAERFARECRILASLEVPGIARLYDAGVDEHGVPYIAMEYVPGESITDWCDAHTLDRAARIAVFVQVIEAVGRAHAQKIIHRDLKPSNIFVTQQGDVRLLDFGVARLLLEEPDGTSVTQAWGRALTPEYASPEMLRGATVDARSDIYSLGVVLHELLTGVRPAEHLAPRAAADAQTLPRGLHAVLMKALASSPAGRYPDADGFAAALRPFAVGEDAAVPINRRRFFRAVVAAAGIAAIAVVVGIFVFDRHGSTRDTVVAAATNAEVSLAVLPFADLSAARDQEYLCEGMADEIINQLAQIPALRLVGLRSTLTFKGRNEDLRAIGEKLGVEHLLDGTIRKDGDRLRIAAQLLRARDGTPLWSKVYDREQRDVFKVQEEIARDVAQALSVKLDVGPMNRAQGGTTNVDAYDRYLRWRQLFLAERQSLDDFRQRAQLLREAVQFDPRFVLAWGELADELDALAFYVELPDQQIGGSQAATLRGDASRARTKVMDLAPESWIALRIRSEQLANEGRWAEAMAVARQILDSGPFTLERAYPYTDVIFAVGHFDETVALVDRVIRIEPLVMFPSRDQQWNLTAARRHREAEVEYQRSRAFEGAHSTPEFISFLRALALNREDRAAVRAAYDRILKSTTRPDGFGLLNELDSVLDDRAALRAKVLKFAELGRTPHDLVYGIADAVNEPEAALTALLAELKQPGNVGFRKYWEPWILPFSNVRTLPGFKKMLRDAGIVDYWRTTGNWGDFCKPVGADDFECH